MRRLGIGIKSDLAMEHEFVLDVSPLFSKLDKMLLSLLRSLTPEEWNRPTVAKLWTVKDVASHLLDGNIRALSLQRDRHFGEKPPEDLTYSNLVAWLNQLNADWIKASRRMSTDVLIMFHEVTGPPTSAYYQSLKSDEKSIFAVSWSGETESKNGFHVAREYTEKWLHQQQIRHATSKPGLLTEEFFLPFMTTLVQALPYTFRGIDANVNTMVSISTTGECKGTWCMKRYADGWRLTRERSNTPTAEVRISADMAWKLFSKSIRPMEMQGQFEIFGDARLGNRVMEMVSFMV